MLFTNDTQEEYVGRTEFDRRELIKSSGAVYSPRTVSIDEFEDDCSDNSTEQDYEDDSNEEE